MKLLLSIFLAFGLTSSQWQFKNVPADSTMSILGTSSVHDWESVVTDFEVAGTMNNDIISNLNVEVVVTSIESGKSIMDDKTHDALLSGKFPKIYFKADRLEVIDSKIKGKGVLTMAGESRPIAIVADAKLDANKRMEVKGSVDLKMSDFGIDPPTAMFGSLQTGDEVTIKYQLLLNN